MKHTIIHGVDNRFEFQGNLSVEKQLIFQALFILFY